MTLNQVRDRTEAEPIDSEPDPGHEASTGKNGEGAPGDHPDPVALGAPAYDSQGLLRWGSLPGPRLNR